MIEAYGLTRRFGTFTAVSQVSLHVPDGAILALLGPNGAGKTTTIRMLSGLLAPTEGNATVAGYDIRREPDAVRACVGLVTDTPGLFEQMKVPAYLDFFGSIEAYRAVFDAFLTRLTPGGALVACADDPGAAALASAAGRLCSGFEACAARHGLPSPLPSALACGMG